MSETCPVCGEKGLQKIRDDLKKCTYCGQYVTDKGIFYKFQVMGVPKELKQLREATAKIVEPEVTPDQRTFINRIAQKLASTTGLSGEAKRRALKVQEQFRRELTDIFMGEGDFNRWFDEKRTQLGLHTYNLAKIIFESLKGLKSTEAQSLRRQYAQAIQRLGM